VLSAWSYQRSKSKILPKLAPIMDAGLLAYQFHPRRVMGQKLHQRRFAATGITEDPFIGPPVRNGDVIPSVLYLAKF
jgi:hypothetical protein